MTGTEPQTPAASRTPVWVRVVLVLSLGLNLLVVGLVAGAVLIGGGPREVAREAGVNPFIAALPSDQRRAVFGDIRREAGSGRRSHSELRSRFEALLTEIRAEEFDAAAVEALLEEQRSAGTARQEAGERLLIARLSQMTQAERVAYADRLEETLKRRGPPRDRERDG